MKDAQIAFFDLETTGTNPLEHRIIEIAFCDIERRRKFELLIDPQQRIENSDFHGITDELIETEKAVPFAENVEEIEEWIYQQFGEEVVFIAHNSWQFDQQFLEAEYTRIGRRIPKTWMFADSLKIAKNIELPIRNRKLSEIYMYFQGKEIENAHRALSDAFALAEIYPYLIEQYEVQRQQTFQLQQWTRSANQERFRSKITRSVNTGLREVGTKANPVLERKRRINNEVEIRNPNERLQTSRRLKEKGVSLKKSLLFYLRFPDQPRRTWIEENILINEKMVHRASASQKEKMETDVENMGRTDVGNILDFL